MSESQEPEDQEPEDQEPEDQEPEDQKPEDQKPEDQQPEDQASGDQRDWVDSLTGIAGAFGFNRVKVRWKLQRLQNRWHLWRRRAARKSEQVRYAHKTCPHCGAVQDKSEKQCTSCGEPLGARRWQVLQRLGIRSPVAASMSTLLGVSFVVIYGMMILENGGGGIASLPVPMLYEWGGNYGPAIELGEYWRFATACFLHAGLWHLGFNLIALAIVGPSVEELYGRFQLLFVFLLTGVIASIGSHAMHPDAVAIGASGGLMGLVGLVAGWGHRQGTGRGRDIRNQMLKWAAYVMVFGFMIGADNWAHGFGFVSGGLLGFAVDARKLAKPAFKPLRFVTGLIGAGGCVAFVALILTGVPSDNRFGSDESRQAAYAERLRQIGRICERAARDTQKADRQLKEILGDQMPAEGAAVVCEELERLRLDCEQAREQSDPQADVLPCSAVLD